ncbi:phage tail tip lysozyme [Acetobacter orientalis]|uniref:phage tail tip lysozyme n=1 Tax=Acetobacter orientalis TaxID=146474 RepID=UPI0039E93E46
MATAVKIQLSAVDRASAFLDKINGKIVSLQAPIRNASRSLARFAAVSGISTVRKGMVDLSRATFGAFQSVGRLVPEMGALTGAASIAGVYRLASAWARVGTNLRTSARSIGMNPGRLMALQNAARLSGGSADAMSGALSQLSTQKWEAVNGFAPEAAAQFQALGISMEEVKKLSPEQLFGRIATKIRGIKDPAAQSIAALKLFGDAGKGLLPIFQQSGKEFQDNIKLSERYGVMNKNGADAAARLQKAQTQLTLAVEGFGYSIAEAVEPAITPIVQQMAEWIAANREWIAQDIGGYVKQLAKWLKEGGWEKIRDSIMGIAAKISDVVDKLGGWKSAAKDAAIGLAVLWAAPFLAGIVTLTTALIGVSKAMGSIASQRGGILAAMTAFRAYEMLSDARNGVTDSQQQKNRDFITNLPGLKQLSEGYSWVFRSLYGVNPDDIYTPKQDLNAGSTLMQSLRANNGLGLNENAIQGVTAAGIAESHLQVGAKNPLSSARGAYQFLRATRNEIMQEQGIDVWQADVKEQTNAALKYYRQHYPKQFAKFSAASSPQEAMRLFTHDFLRPGDGEADDITRGSAFLKHYAAQNQSAPAAIIKPPAAKGGGSDLSGTIDRLRVEISHDNAPPGSSVKVTSASPGIKVASVTQRAMDPLNTAIGN